MKQKYTERYTSRNVKCQITSKQYSYSWRDRSKKRIKLCIPKANCYKSYYQTLSYLSNHFFQENKQTFSKILSFLQLYWSGIRYMLIFITQLLVMFLKSYTKIHWTWKFVESSEGLKFLTRIRVGLSHMADHKF